MARDFTSRVAGTDRVVDARTAAQNLLEALPMIGNGDTKDIACWDSGKVQLLLNTLDRAFLRGTLQGMSEGHITSGDIRIAAVLSPICTKLDELCDAKNAGNDKVPNTDITSYEWSIAARERLATAIRQAARYGLMTDNLALQHERGHQAGYQQGV